MMLARPLLVPLLFASSLTLGADAGAADRWAPIRFFFATERFENPAVGWRGPDECVETFEVARPRKPFEDYSVNRFGTARSAIPNPR